MYSISEKEKLLLSNFINEFNSGTKSFEEKFELINLIIQLESKSEHFNDELYKHIKTWMSLYIKITQKKQYGYDRIIPNKVIEIINYLSIEERISIINYFIRLMKKNLLIDEIDYFEMHRIILEIELEYSNKKYCKWLIKKSILNLTNLSIALLMILLSFTIILHYFLVKFKFLKVAFIDYNSNLCLNIFINVIDYIFEISGDVKPENFAGLIFFLIIKFIVFILITYFLINKITKKLDRL